MPMFNAMPVPPAEFVVTLEYCVDDIDVIANDNIDGLSARRGVENRRCRRDRWPPWSYVIL